METNNKLKLLTWAVIILVVVNISALALLWINSGKEKDFRKESPRGKMEKGREKARERSKDPVVRMLSEELGWSDEQMKKFEALKTVSFKNAQDMRDSILLIKKDLLGAIYTIPVDSARITELTKKLGNTQYNIEHVMFLHFTDIVNICTPSQREKCKDLLNKLILEGNAHSGNHEEGPEGHPGPPPR